MPGGDGLDLAARQFPLKRPSERLQNVRRAVRLDLTQEYEGIHVRQTIHVGVLGDAAAEQEFLDVQPQGFKGGLDRLQPFPRLRGITIVDLDQELRQVLVFLRQQFLTLKVLPHLFAQVLKFLRWPLVAAARASAAAAHAYTPRSNRAPIVAQTSDRISPWRPNSAKSRFTAKRS